jgi:AcrR family transcriptional regulator
VNTKEKILVSARNLFTDYGYKKVSMEEIASSSGVTKKTVYSYFDDKESLLMALIEEEILAMKSIIDSYSSDKNLDIFVFLNKTLYALLKYKKDSKLLVRLNREVNSSNSVNIENTINSIDDSIISFIKEKILMLKDKVNLNIDIDLCAFVIYKVYLSIMFEYDKDIDEEKFTHNVTQILKNGLFNK